MPANVSPGDEAPDFEAKITDGEDVGDFQLSEALGDGPVVIGFFPFAFTGVCGSQMADLDENLDEFAAEDAAVYGLSVSSPFALQAWAEQAGFGFELIADWNREAVEAFGLHHEEMMGLEKPAQRATVVLNSQGTVEWVWATEDPGEKPDVDEILGVVRKTA